MRFAVVEGAGAAVNMSALCVLSWGAGLPLAAASALAVELAAISNYLLDDSRTFARRRPSLPRFAKFNVASLMGLGFNVFTVWYLAHVGVHFLAADAAGIVAGFTVNHAFGVSWVWGRAA